MRKLLAVLTAALSIFLVACSAETNPPSNVTSNSAQLNGQISWVNGDGPGELWYEISRNGAAFTEVPGSRTSYTNQTSSGSSVYNRVASNLTPGIWRYRICGFGDRAEHPDIPDSAVYCVDKNSNGVHPPTQDTNNYDAFGIAENDCDKTVAGGTSFSSTISGVSSGQTVCLSEDTYNWGEVTVPGGIRILGLGSGTVVIGGFNLPNDGTTIENLHLEVSSGVSPAGMFITGDNVVSRRVDVDVNGVPNVQGYIVGNGGVQTSGVQLLDGKVHHTRGSVNSCTASNGHQFIHSIYWANGINGQVDRMWLYDNAAFGLHFYSGVGGSAAGTDVDQIVTDDSLCVDVGPDSGNVFNDIAGASTASFDRTIITDAGPWACNEGNTVTNSRANQGFLGCNGSGNVTADTTYQNEAGRDYRVPGNSNFQFVPGPQ